MKNKKIILLSVIALFSLFIIATIMYQNKIDTNTQQLAKNTNGAPFIREHSPSFGNNKNKVIITEFFDPQCESCKAFHPIIEEVFNDYKEETKLALRYLAFHNYSKFAVKLLEASRMQNKFNEALDTMFQHQEKWAEHNREKPELLWEFLAKTTIDMKKLRKDFNTIDVDDILALDQKDAHTLGVTGTPTFYVNGKHLRELSHKALLDLVESEIYK